MRGQTKKEQKRFFWTLLLATAVISGFSNVALGAGFSIVGTRALGMGGAQVAIPDDATAVYWNPAALADHEGWKYNLPLGLRAEEHNDIIDTLDDVDDILGDYDLDDPEIYLDQSKVSQLVEIFTELGKPGTGFVIDGNVGLIVNKDNIAFSLIDLVYFGGWVTMDLERVVVGEPSISTSIANNNSSATILGLESREVAATYAHEVYSTEGRGRILVGGNVKYIAGRSYYKTESIANEDNDDEDELAEMSDSGLGLDASVLYLPGGKWQAGLVIRNLNSPSFSYEDGKIDLEIQARAGMAYEINDSLLIAADLDLTENETMTPGYGDRKLAVGIEKKLFGEKLAVRGGLYKNIAESDADIVVTGGLGIGSSKFKFDLAAGIDPNMEELAFCLGLSAAF